MHFGISTDCMEYLDHINKSSSEDLWGRACGRVGACRREARNENDCLIKKTPEVCLLVENKYLRFIFITTEVSTFFPYSLFHPLQYYSCHTLEHKNRICESQMSCKWIFKEPRECVMIVQLKRKFCHVVENFPQDKYWMWALHSFLKNSYKLLNQFDLFVQCWLAYSDIAVHYRFRLHLGLFLNLSSMSV